MNGDRDKKFKRQVFGLIPAAGQGLRIAPLPCSKEIFPVGFKREEGRDGVRPKPVCHYLLEKMRLAGIVKVYIVLGDGKWDIPHCLRSGVMLDMHLAYLITDLRYGVPYTIDQAYPFLKHETVAFGFPDLIFESDDVFVQLLSYLENRDVDVVLGVFPSNRPDKADMIDLDDHGQIRKIILKPGSTHLRYTWGIAVWKPVFTHFLHQFLIDTKKTATNKPELSMSEVIEVAIQNKVRVQAVIVSDEPFLDIGTGDDLLRAVQRSIVYEE